MPPEPPVTQSLVLNGRNCFNRGIFSKFASSHSSHFLIYLEDFNYILFPLFTLDKEKLPVKFLSMSYKQHFSICSPPCGKYSGLFHDLIILLDVSMLRCGNDDVNNLHSVCLKGQQNSLCQI